MSNYVESETDLMLVKEFLLLPILLDVLERDKRAINKASLKMKAEYIEVLDRMQDLVTQDLSKIRKQMRAHEIKVYEQQRTDIALRASYVCRGYHHSTSMLWGLVRADLMVRLGTYSGVDISKKEKPRS